MAKVNNIDVYAVKEKLKECSKDVQDYVRALEEHISVQRTSIETAIKRIKEAENLLLSGILGAIRIGDTCKLQNCGYLEMEGEVFEVWAIRKDKDTGKIYYEDESRNEWEESQFVKLNK